MEPAVPNVRLIEAGYGCLPELARRPGECRQTKYMHLSCSTNI